ncbi:restriction endonuclease [Peribacillus frigoritolerans]|uniref:restriction endonuclease n=1 Tax=Peribacillus frigoritolerans TaxID=450367 RepID=UPI00381FB7EF
MKTRTIFKPGICRLQAKKCKETKEGDTIFIHADLCKFMEGSYFEQFIAEIYSFLGYDISWTKTTGDQGLDLIANRKVEDGTIERIGIQCKRYNGKVENSAVGICSKYFYKCEKAIVVTPSYFTASARELVDLLDVEIVGKTELNRLLKQIQELLLQQFHREL